MNPKKVNHKKFQLLDILFDNQHFSIAYGIWEEESNVLAMRWNDSPTDIGYPTSNGHPTWFIINDEVKVPFIKSLIGISSSDIDAILRTLKTELP